MEKVDRDSLVSSERRLLCNCGNLLAFRGGGPAVPVTLFVSPTNRCQLRCPQCLYGGRQEGEELDWGELSRFAETTAGMGVKAWELTGGGEPLLYPRINELIHRLVGLGTAVGLMTNGLALDRLEYPGALRWIRVSLHGLPRHEAQIVGNIEAVRGQTKVTCCHLATRENLPLLARVRKLAAKHGWTVKVEPDWFVQDSDEAADLREAILDRIDGSDNLFLDPETPDYGRESSLCYMHLVKPFLYSDGWVYPCPCATGAGRFPSPQFRICPMDGIEAYCAAAPVRRIQYCQACKYEALNRAAQAILEPLDNPEFC